MQLLNCFLICVLILDTAGLFVKENWLDSIRTSHQQNHGVAVSDVNHDGAPDFIVAGFTGANFVFTYDKTSGTVTNIAQEGTPYAELRDISGNATGVAACDIDGDEKEEIYFLNTNKPYADSAAYRDRLFKWRDGKYVDLYSDSVNADMPAKEFAGRSVACVDRNGTGIYSFVLATNSAYGEGQLAMIEMDSSHPENNASAGRIILRNVGGQVGIARSTVGCGIVVGPILGNNGRSDIYFGNEGYYALPDSGANYLFMNNGDGTFTDTAEASGVADADRNVRGISLADFNRDGKIDIAYGNWGGRHRLYLQTRINGNVNFTNVATGNYETPTHIRTVIAADFDNDGMMEVFQNNIHHPGHLQPNKLFKIVPNGNNVTIQNLDIGDALEPEGYGTGAAVTDFDGDGKLELLISHGGVDAQPLTIFTVSNGTGNNWIRFQPRTKYGAPARGSAVKVTTDTGTAHLHVIDGGSGYLCEMEPYAHIGLGAEAPAELYVQWPDGTTVSKVLTSNHMNKIHIIDYPTSGSLDQGTDQSTTTEVDQGTDRSTTNEVDQGTDQSTAAGVDQEKGKSTPAEADQEKDNSTMASVDDGEDKSTPTRFVQWTDQRTRTRANQGTDQTTTTGTTECLIGLCQTSSQQTSAAWHLTPSSLLLVLHVSMLRYRV